MRQYASPIGTTTTPTPSAYAPKQSHLSPLLHLLNRATAFPPKEMDREDEGTRWAGNEEI